MKLVKCDNSQILPYELIELVMNHLPRKCLVTLYINATKYNPHLSRHIAVAIKQTESPLRIYITYVYDNISSITTRVRYLNIIINLHNIKLHDNKERENVIYINSLLQKITNERDKIKFKNLMLPVGRGL
jgi:hypothetical protein